ncbi:diacylglycerol kinase family protein [Leptolyngbya sp. FACHB-261]|uniref:diacylglycerol/lipid kinase family protein n=1 Tax=Leptolyngbya sp. FACHB-261 TaxID=2692806 RepID=UPI001683437B|nr:diacylglycerol kinase family protein [Leptolyngbya sp. FACHB-261]MBD2104403.1 diacylglycerol kinase family lipid kinase [Leptolyngbya sp. FACHB-261]
MDTLLIVNPTSGPNDQASLLRDIIKALQDQNIRAEVSLTTPDSDGQALAAEAAQAGTKLVIAAGGDGTIEAVARGLIHTSTALGIIPLGTRNNIAASLSIPNNLEQAARILVEGESCQIDVGKANDHYFLEVVGIGLEAVLFPCGDEVKEAVKKNRLALLRSVLSGLKIFSEFRSHRLVLRLNGRRLLRLRTLQVNICNSPRYGMEFALAPNAKMDDGKLDVIYLDNASKWEHLQHFFTAMRGQPLSREQLRTYQAARIEVRSYHPLKVHADGDCIGNTPLTVEVVPKALRVRVPTPELLTKFAEEEGQSSIPALSELPGGA